MGKKNNTIRINGQHYDARTGAPIKSLGARHLSQSIDGVSGLIEPTPLDVPGVQVSPSLSFQATPTMQDVVRRPTNMATRNLQPSQTLMRRAVKKPGKQAHLKAQTATHHNLQKRTPHSIALKTAVHTMNEYRLERAKKIGQSHSIRRFGDSQFRPTAAAAQLAAGQTATGRKDPDFMPAPPPIVGKPKTTADVLQHALQHANSHEQAGTKKHHKPIHHKRLAVVGIGFISLALIAFVALQNVTSVKLQLASAKAGFTAAVPTNGPSGYHVASMQYSPGVVTIVYQSNSDSRQYTLTEKSSSWDSNTLKQMFVAVDNTSYQTVQADGRTVYIYGSGNATWVNGGIWYQVTSNSALSSRQLVSLASSF